MSALAVAQGRRHFCLQELRGKRADVQRTIDLGVHTTQGLIDEYRARLMPELQARAEALDAEIAELEALEDDALIERLVPEAFQPALPEPAPRGRRLLTSTPSNVPWGAA